MLSTWLFLKENLRMILLEVHCLSDVKTYAMLAPVWTA